MAELKANNWRMVICYHLPAVANSKGHAIYAKDYDFNSGTFSCVNSWGDDLEPYPNIRNDKVYDLFYVSINDYDTTEMNQ